MKRSNLLLLVCVILSQGACGSSGTALPDGGGAGTGGAGTGGPQVALDCPSYCAAIQAACTMGNQQYGDKGTCELGCPAFPVGASGDTAGDTLGCRIHEAALAAGGAAAAAVHCRRAGPGGDGTCGDNCDGYCDLVMTFCTTAKNAQIFDTRAACLADCRSHRTDVDYTAGAPETDEGNSVACLLYHGAMAPVFPALHCLDHLATTAATCHDSPP